ncbi:MAG: 50S ribosomal protein L17 [Candidatus Andersenbacteria bacterium]|nr:50S ribosomal protein L17 [Candidatus Andersenbacteria bacterium]MBI3250323.1 50S ribosomal protein L17 [Candidatus Andersenbacteria bacterium]
MKHRHGNRILSRTAADRGQLLRTLSKSLLTHHSIVTTEAKGKELKKFFEPLMTTAKEELTLARRRKLLAILQGRDHVEQLVKVAKDAKSRPGGYLRLTKLPRTRKDNAQEVRVDFVD